MLSGLTACEDFLTREPINKFSAESYFSSESDLEMYANGMINSWLPNSSETNGGDAYNDLIATKTSTDFYRPSAHWDSSKQGGWGTGDWSFLRRVNYMINNMDKAKSAVSSDIYNHYEGVARFWRAMKYVAKVNTFSNVPGWRNIFSRTTLPSSTAKEMTESTFSTRLPKTSNLLAPTVWPASSTLMVV